MTTERDFDRLAQAWLELSPNEVPDRTIEAVLQAIRTTPQVRRPGAWPVWRLPVMNRNILVAGVAVVIVVALGAVLLLGRAPNTSIGGPSSSPTPSRAVVPSPSPSPTEAGGPVPSQLQARWMGGAGTIAGIDPDAGTSMLFDGDSFALSQSNANATPMLDASAAALDGQVVRLQTVDVSRGCPAGTVGRYAWSLSADGRTLTLTAQGDDCAARRGAVPGTWHLDGCRDAETDCLGDLAAGTYPSQYIAPRVKPGQTWGPVFAAVTYAVPDGWANSSDWPDRFGLTLSSDYAQVKTGGDEGSRNVVVVTQPTPVSQKNACVQATDPTVARTAAGEITWLRHVPGLITSAATPITIDGHAGQWVDIRLNPSWAGCPGGGPEVDYLRIGAQGTLSTVGIVGTAERQRVVVLDLGNGDPVAIVISTATAAQFTAFAAQAMPVVESLTFK